ncbi:hypothetical protein Tco_1047120 [Tanacetum coccineum]
MQGRSYLTHKKMQDTNTWNKKYPDGFPFGDRKEEAVFFILISGMQYKGALEMKVAVQRQVHEQVEEIVEHSLQLEYAVNFWYYEHGLLQMEKRLSKDFDLTAQIQA